MATETLLVDVGMLYKRLFDHRPIIQNEVHYFVKEFENKHEEGEFKTLQDAISKADEINNVFLNEIMCSNPHFKTIKEKGSAIKATFDKILSKDDFELTIPQEEQDRLDQQIEELQLQMKQKQQEVFSINEEESKKLKEEIREVREARVKMRSLASSISSSVAIFSPATTPSEPDQEEVMAEQDQKEEQDSGTEEELQTEKDPTKEVNSDGERHDLNT